MSKWTAEHLTPYLLSLPERVLRSATALAGGLLREIGEVTIPRTIRRSQLYQNLVEATLRFLIEQVGQVGGVYPTEDKLTEDFLLRRTAGNGIELIGILAFRASPVWVLAALADASGAGRYLIREIADCLKEEGLLDRGSDFSNVDQMLDGLERSAARLASALNTPPLDVATLRQEWGRVRRDLSKIPPKNLPTLESLGSVWTGMKQEAREQNRTVFEVSSLMAMSAIADLPQRTRWLSASVRLAVNKTGSVMAGILLVHYRTTLKQIHESGYYRYAVHQFRPYLYAAASQFSPRRRSLTERLLLKRIGSR
ncbi:MAG: hypothetical protein DMG12_10720 [Acidobacteria bacterium]|nr:MAG: hypothetical protein DMG12_10720 [Acidobacteriota bacterium]